MPQNMPDIKPEKTIGGYMMDALREAHAWRPASFYLLLAIPLVMLLGLHMVFFVHNPKRFAFILSLMIIFLGVVVLLALIDVIEIARKNLTGKRDTFRDTLGDDAFIHELGRRVNNEQENERSGKET
ncbi:MAG TPA: hypothetical protein PLI09_01675 [Candidatus Hydrogenedentes bacterium]|nr:hypothetical protein [Candidatus Hydrogenedentota bacterium]